MKIVPVILVGGYGTRLWPMSRKSYPKQFITGLVGDKSLFQETLLRVSSMAMDFAPFLIVGNTLHYDITIKQIEELNLTNYKLISEPLSRNTAPSMALSAFQCIEEHGEDVVLLILPSDHLIADADDLEKNIKKGIYFVEDGKIVTFGVLPKSPATGYGYIETGAKLNEGVFEIESFKEKPTIHDAKKYVEAGNFFWNSGMFLMQARTYLIELYTFAHDIYVEAEKAYLNSTYVEKEIIPERKYYEACRKESIDYAIMEHTKKGVNIPINSNWSDLGCWLSILENKKLDEDRNYLSGEVIAIDTENCLIKSTNKLIASIGIKNTVILDTEDALLVVDKGCTQKIKQLTDKIEKIDKKLLVYHKKVERPWGYFEELYSGKGFKVKHLVISMNGVLSLQLHKHRSEHWVVVEGIADVVYDSESKTLHPNQSLFIPPNTKHRLSNSRKDPLHIIETQFGDYLEEDDIIRFEDIYGRTSS